MLLKETIGSNFPLIRLIWRNMYVLLLTELVTYWISSYQEMMID